MFSLFRLLPFKSLYSFNSSLKLALQKLKLVYWHTYTNSNLLIILASVISSSTFYCSCLARKDSTFFALGRFPSNSPSTIHIRNNVKNLLLLKCLSYINELIMLIGSSTLVPTDDMMTGSRLADSKISKISYPPLKISIILSRLDSIKVSYIESNEF